MDVGSTNLFVCLAAGSSREKKTTPVKSMMGEQGDAAADTQLFKVLGNLLQQVEALTNQEEVELRAKIEALGLEVTKVPSKTLNELEIAKELDTLSAKLDHVDEMISSTMAEDPQVKTLLSSTADLWMPVITATSDKRRNLATSIEDGSSKSHAKNSN